jgi:hypothetical protein
LRDGGRRSTAPDLTYEDLDMVATILRFGRRIPIPSTVQILHDYRVFAEDCAMRERCAVEDGLPAGTSWADIASHRAEAAT